MTVASLSSSNFSVNREMTSWLRELFKRAKDNFKSLVKLDDGFQTCVPKALEQKIQELQRMLLSWLRSHAESGMNLSALSKAILKDRELNEILHEIRRDVEKMKPAEGGPVTLALQLLISAIRAPELMSAPDDGHTRWANVLSDHYLEKMANGSVALTQI